MRHFNGFNLFEILIVLVIISILAAMYSPLYSRYLARAYRLEAAISLEKLAAALEQYYTIHNTYEAATLKNLGFSSSIAKNNYQLAIFTANDYSFILQAKPESSQAERDRLCGMLTLNTLGEKSITGNGKVMDCWS